MKRQKKGSNKAAPLSESHDKDKEFRAQYLTVYKAFKEYPKTMLDVSLETGILRANICRYVADMEDKGIIKLLYKSDDKHTKFMAGYYTTNNALFPTGND